MKTVLSSASSRSQDGGSPIAGLSQAGRFTNKHLPGLSLKEFMYILRGIQDKKGEMKSGG